MQLSRRTPARSVLLLEDDALVAADIATQIDCMGFLTLGPCHTATQAMALIADTRPDLAILDFTLDQGTSSAPVARRLSEMGVPFSFLSGHSHSGEIGKAGFRDAPCLGKPVLADDLSRMLDTLSDTLPA